MKPISKTTDAPQPSWNRRLGSVVFLIILAALPVVAYFWYDPPFVLVGLAIFYLVSAWVLKSRAIWGTLIGIALGGVFYHGDMVRDASSEARILTTLSGQFFGGLIGFGIGWLWDQGTKVPVRNNPPRKKPRKT